MAGWAAGGGLRVWTGRGGGGEVMGCSVTVTRVGQQGLSGGLSGVDKGEGAEGPRRCSVGRGRSGCSVW